MIISTLKIRQWQELKYTNIKNRCINVYKCINVCTYMYLCIHTHIKVPNIQHIYKGTRKNIILTGKKKIREGFM